MTAATLRVQGTTSNTGKSVLVAGLCRCFSRRGVKVAPFKPQKIAHYSAVTADGGPIGRVQAVRAQARGLAPTVFESPAAPASVLRWAGLAGHETPDYRGIREAALDRLADSLEQHLGLGHIEGPLRRPVQGRGTEAS